MSAHEQEDHWVENMRYDREGRWPTENPIKWAVYGWEWVHPYGLDPEPDESPEWRIVEAYSGEDRFLWERVRLVAYIRADGELVRWWQLVPEATLRLVVAAWKGSQP